MSEWTGFVYAIVVDGVSRYIGISNKPEERLKQHLREAAVGTRGLFYQKLRSAVVHGSKIEQVILHSSLNKNDAANLEISEIKSLGGHQRRGRQLWNTHSGGLGGASDNSSIAVRALWATPEFRTKMSNLAREQMARQRLDPAFERRRAEGIKRSPFTAKKLELARANIDRDRQRAAASAAAIVSNKRRALANR